MRLALTIAGIALVMLGVFLATDADAFSLLPAGAAFALAGGMFLLGRGLMLTAAGILFVLAGIGGLFMHLESDAYVAAMRHVPAWQAILNNLGVVFGPLLGGFALSAATVSSS